jgi:hypothetical protein
MSKQPLPEKLRFRSTRARGPERRPNHPDPLELNRLDLCNPNIIFGLATNQGLLLSRIPTASVKFYVLLSIMYLTQGI